MLLVGVTLNLFSNNSSSLSLALSSLSLAMAALPQQNLISSLLRLRRTSHSYIPLFDKELLCLGENAVLAFAEHSSNCVSQESMWRMHKQLASR